MNNFKRAATPEEIHDYKLIEELIEELTEEQFSDFLDTVSDYLLSSGAERRAAYGKVYRLAKRMGVSIKALDNWYFTEPAC